MDAQMRLKTGTCLAVEGLQTHMHTVTTIPRTQPPLQPHTLHHSPHLSVTSSPSVKTVGPLMAAGSRPTTSLNSGREELASHHF